MSTPEFSEDFTRDPLFRHEVEDGLDDEQVLYLKLTRVDEEAVALLNTGNLTNLTALAFASMLRSLADEIVCRPFQYHIAQVEPEDLDLIDRVIDRDEYDRHVTGDDDHAYRTYLRGLGFNPDLPVSVEVLEEDPSKVVLTQFKAAEA